MAQKVVVTLVDDMDPTDRADETIQFGVDGNTYELDLASERAAALRDTFARYIAVARKRRAALLPNGSQPQRVDRNDKEQREAIRRWARQEGLPVPGKGRISRELREKYRNRGGPTVEASTPKRLSAAVFM